MTPPKSFCDGLTIAACNRMMAVGFWTYALCPFRVESLGEARPGTDPPLRKWTKNLYFLEIIKLPFFGGAVGILAQFV